MSSSLKLDPLAERMKRMLCTGVDADIHFLVGQEGDEHELLAHKSVLRTASDVFDAMFRFDDEFSALTKKRMRTRRSEALSEVSNTGQVLIPDVDVEAFKTMLDFIYTDNLSGVNGKNAIDVLYAANKYNLPMLAKACVDIPISKLDNVFIAFAKARLLEEKDFAGRCLAYIDRNADTLIKSDEFLQIDQKLLCELLGRDQLVVTEEITIWNAALRWADEQCRQKGLDYSPENRRQVLGSALFQIRFPIIPKDFLKDIVSSCVLTSAELVAVLLYYSLGDSSNVGAKSQLYPLPFSIRHRSAEFTLKIKKFSEFSKANETHREYSEAVSIGGFKWRIYAKIVTESDTKYLGLYLYCHNHGSNWSCPCSATLRILSQKQGKVDFAWTFDHTFQSNKKIWGLPRFKSFMEVINTSNGWYMEKEDTVILSANVTVKE